MFEAIKATIRAYIVRILAEQVAQDIIEMGLTDADRATIDAALAVSLSGDRDSV